MQMPAHPLPVTDLACANQHKRYAQDSFQDSGMQFPRDSTLGGIYESTTHCKDWGELSKLEYMTDQELTINSYLAGDASQELNRRTKP